MDGAVAEIIFGDEEAELELIFQTGQGNPSRGPLQKAGSLKRSHIWTYFQESSDPKWADCKVCNSKISRGGTGKSASTKPLRNHLSSKHPKQFEDLKLSEAADNKKKSGKPDAEQPTLPAFVMNQTVWDRQNPKACEYNYLIGEMMALDNQPYSVVENNGFKRLMLKALPRYNMPGRKFFTKKIVPDIYRRVRKIIQIKIDKAKYLSFTTDIWTAPHSNESFISLTAHWVSDAKEHAILCSRNFPGSHTGESICEMLRAMLSDWNVNDQRVHMMLRDGGPNVVKGAAETNLPNEGCFLHALQLVIGDAINSQGTVRRVIAMGRNIVKHFNHSSVACTKLKEIQLRLGVKVKRLMQDVPTRWNSTYYMLESVSEQKLSITLFAAECPGKINVLDESQWSVLQSALSLLKPFEEITKIISEAESCISEVIPAIATLQRYLSKQNSLHDGVEKMKSQLKTSLTRRLQYVFENKNFNIATALDPRYRFNFFTETSQETMKQNVLEEILVLTPEEPSSTTDNCGPPPEKFPRTDTHSALWDCFAEISNATGTQATNAHGETSNSTISREALLKSEIKLYASAPLLDRKLSPFAWWKTNEGLFPNLHIAMEKYLSAPASTVYSERLFSEAGNIYEDKRNRLTPQNGESLIFLHHNLEIVDFKY